MSNKAFLNKTKKNLLTQYAELVKKSSQHIDIDMEGDEIDEVQGNMLMSLHNQLTSRDSVKLNQIQDALKRIDDSTYGICDDCGEKIPEKRLLVNPYFLNCISCAEAKELQDKLRKRF